MYRSGADNKVYVCKSNKYFRVYKIRTMRGKIRWRACGEKHKYFHSERKAAIYVDIYYIKKGKEPRNILTRI